MAEATPVRVTLSSDPVFEQHETGAHPECADRLRSIRRRLAGSDLPARTSAGEIRKGTAEELGRVHPEAYQQLVRKFAEQGGGRLDPDTVVCTESETVAVTAAGTACAAVDAVLTDKADRALCLVRPPGHHALASRAMGFCLFNNIAIAAEHALSQHGLERVLIVDWDVHHGNGTQDIFYEDGGVYFFSAHRYPFYPGTGAADETGAREGLGATLNLPIEFGVSRSDYRDAFRQGLETIAERCRPELILISAGFDAHKDDPIGSLGLESEDFATLTRDVLEVARSHAGERVVSLLEGGYNLEALAESVEFHLAALLEESS